MIFNIYYINFPKVYEIKMMFVAFSKNRDSFKFNKPDKSFNVLVDSQCF
jgi:hypothetical protein